MSLLWEVTKMDIEKKISDLQEDIYYYAKIIEAVNCCGLLF